MAKAKEGRREASQGRTSPLQGPKEPSSLENRLNSFMESTASPKTTTQLKSPRSLKLSGQQGEVDKLDRFKQPESRFRQASDSKKDGKETKHTGGTDIQGGPKAQGGITAPKEAEAAKDAGAKEAAKKEAAARETTSKRNAVAAKAVGTAAKEAQSRASTKPKVNEDDRAAGGAGEETVETREAVQTVAMDAAPVSDNATGGKEPNNGKVATPTEAAEKEGKVKMPIGAHLAAAVEAGAKKAAMKAAMLERAMAKEAAMKQAAVKEEVVKEEAGTEEAIQEEAKETAKSETMVQGLAAEETSEKEGRARSLPPDVAKEVAQAEALLAEMLIGESASTSEVKQRSGYSSNRSATLPTRASKATNVAEDSVYSNNRPSPRVHSSPPATQTTLQQQAARLEKLEKAHRARVERAEHPRNWENPANRERTEQEQIEQEFAESVSGLFKGGKGSSQVIISCEIDEERWQHFEQRITSIETLQIQDIPFPNKHKRAFIDTEDARKSDYKRLMLRWHPDKFMQKFGSLIHSSSREEVEDAIKMTFQVIQDSREWVQTLKS